jgi:mannose-1-phosphate guanylyltransferase
MLHAVIMAGGSGTRLWPESRTSRPKQFMQIEDERTLLQATVDRLGPIVPLERIVIATRRDLAGQAQEQLSQLPREAILAEPCPRNTAPCIGLAAIRIARDDPEGTMVVLPADQIISPPEAFQAAVRLAEAIVDDDPRRLVTFGIRPTYPATGFGYIERGEPLHLPATLPGDTTAVHRVLRFHEKPALAKAQEYVEAGRFSWNAGIFVWKARTILEALARFRPEIHAHLMRIAEAADGPQSFEVLQREFAAMEKVSIDYAVMEKADEVVVVEPTFQWDDVGGWLALERYRPRDERGNVTDAERHVAINASGVLLRVADPGHLVVVAGVEDLVVVVTPDATLVANKRDEKSIAAITEELRKRGWTEYL